MIGLKNKKQLNNGIEIVNLLKFLIPSGIGVLLFITPIPKDGTLTIPIALLTDVFMNLFAQALPQGVTLMVAFSAVMSLICKFTNLTLSSKNISKLFNVSTPWLLIRVIGGIASLLVLFNKGPEFIWSDDTGGLLLYELAPILFTVFIFAGMFVPLLMDFGLLEFIGSILNKIMRPLFTLPGRSSIDCIASWLGDGTIGVVLTSKQYEEGYYTKREAAVIGATFSVVSITFCWVVIAQVGLPHMFLPFYLTVALAGFVAALILPRIPPLSKKQDSYNNDNKVEEKPIPQNHNRLTWGLVQATNKAAQSKEFSHYIRKGINNILDMWLGVLPVVMAFGTIALILAEFTPIFSILGTPFIPLLNILNIPEAAEASQTIIVGFADMFLPAILASSIESELTRFVIACVSVSQLIYLSEVGGVILGSKVPISLWELFIIFILRTLITLPIIAFVAHMIF
ncbi:YjiH family protein [Proteinivorax hydrogeniformans]|uniref:YjiH family protein n=1 Tax=Proteinivorax hydrogeniformans TaxID=1826727 RepID=A0AAU8HSR4_9FIRM